jgi:hypothetical protein
MLKLTKRHGPNFYARGTLFKIPIERSLGTSDRGQAEKLFAKLQSEIFERHFRGSVSAGAFNRRTGRVTPANLRIALTGT